MMMSDIKVGDIVSVEEYSNLTGRTAIVGKIYSLSGGEFAGIQVGFENYQQVKLCNCWNATPSQEKQFFKAMLGG